VFYRLLLTFHLLGLLHRNQYIRLFATFSSFPDGFVLLVRMLFVAIVTTVRICDTTEVFARWILTLHGRFHPHKPTRGLVRAWVCEWVATESNRSVIVK